MIRFGIFILVICATGVQCKKFHEYLTPEEMMVLFQTSHESVPEYEVVPVIHGVKKRSLNNFFSVIFLKVFGSDLYLYLEPTDGILAGEGTRVWIAEPDDLAPSGVKYKLISNAVDTNVKTYHDFSNMAAVTIDTDDSGNFLLDGTIGPNLVIRPVPTRLHEIFSESSRQKRESIFSLEKLAHAVNDLKHTIHHVIFKKPDLKENKGVIEPHADLTRFLKNRISRFLPHKGGVIYPEIMVFMDHTLYATFGNDLEAAKRYLISFWNGVDLRYRLLDDPSIRLNIAGIIFSTGKTGVPFVTNNIVQFGLIDADQALIDMGQSLYNEETFIHGQDYDVFVAMTKLDMCNFDFFSFTTCNPEAMGYAYVSTACTVNETSKMVEAVGMIEDNGGFKGIIPGAHELGHLLGASHDETVDGEVKCDIKDGYIMAGGFLLSENGFEWSPCSQRDFTTYLNGPNSTCLRNKPKLDTPVPRVLPGIYYTLQEQCERLYRGSFPCAVDQSVCVKLSCFVPEYNACASSAPAAEGSSCGDNLRFY